MEGEPKFEEQQANVQDVQEQPMNKEMKWQEAERNLEKFAGIEEGIKDTVVGLNVFNIETVNSCEGHNNHGRIAPWVSIERWESRPQERYAGQKDFEQEAYEKLGVTELNKNYHNYLREFDERRAEILGPEKAESDSEEKSRRISGMDAELEKKYEITPEITKKWMDAGVQIDKEVEEAGKDGRLQETEEYKKWKAENDTMKERAQQLLDEFYKDRKVPKNAKIIIDQDAMGSWCLHNGGKDYYDVTRRGDDILDADKKHYQKILDGKNPKKEQKEIEGRVVNYRAEFQEFAKFCKNKYSGKEKSLDRQEAKELSPEFVKEVECSGFGPTEKAYILLVRAGLKPAADVSFNARVWGEGKNDRRVPEDVTKESAQMIENSGLFYKKEEDGGTKEGFTRPDGTDVEYQREHVSYLIGHTQEDLDRIARAVEEKNDKMMGEVFGYPKTAVDAYFGGKQLLDSSRLSKDIRESPAMFFCQFKLSAENWQEELKQGQAWADFIKRVSPGIYEDMIWLGMDVERGKEKEAMWAKKMRELGETTDGLGLGIDEGVKEAVCALNLLGIPTSASCEGHPDSGYNAPWVEISAPGEPDEMYVGQNEAMQKIANKRGVSFDDVIRGTNAEAWREAYKEYSKHKITPEYRKWNKENQKLKKLSARGLSEFYRDRKSITPLSHLEISSHKDFFRVEPIGAKDDWTDSEKRQKFSADRKKRAAKRLSAYQSEMRALTEFLKEKYFTSR